MLLSQLMPKSSEETMTDALKAKRLADRGDFDPPANGDDCVRCEGRNGGVPGNENMINGEPVCDYCVAQEAKRLNYNQKVATTVERLRQKSVRVLVKRRKLTTCLHIDDPGTRDTYTTFILPLIRKDFPEAHMTSGSFTPYMKVTISLEPERNTMKTVYQTCDGKTFELPGEATVHETELFDSWMDSLIKGRAAPTLSTVVRHFNGSHHLTCAADDYHGTPFDMFTESLRMYWEDTEFSN